MKRVMILIVAMVAILFSQSALAQIRFHVGEPLITTVDEVQDEGVAAAAFKIIPLQVYTVNSGGSPWAWWHLNDQFYLRALFTVYGAGTYYTRVKVTDAKTGLFFRYPKEGPFVALEGVTQLITSTPFDAEGDPSALPRQFIFTYEFKVGTIWKGVSTKVLFY